MGFAGKVEKVRPRQADEILEFCKMPRTASEICKMLGFKATSHIKVQYIESLIDSGEIKYTIPDKIKSKSQRFVTTGFETDIITAESVLAYCQIPRRKHQIAEHFGQTNFQMRFIVNPLIESDRLKACDQSIKNNAWRRFVSADSDISADRDEQIQQFCKVPRFRKEIAEFLDISKTATYELLIAQVKAGKLKLLFPERPQSTDQKFMAAEVDIPILTADTIAEFCETARTRKEIAERYGLSQRTARTYIQDFIHKGILTYTIPEYTLSKFQKYIKA